jgi:uncharacterized phage protein (TIGR01671 family)
MNEPRFKAFDLRARQWHEAGDWVIDPESGGARIFAHDEHGARLLGSNRFLVVVRATGLRDRNKKEIYEGDILRISIPKVKNIQEEKEDFGPVEFEDARGRFVFRSSDGCLYGITTDDKANEVIGNIYENQDLLEARRLREAREGGEA